MPDPEPSEEENYVPDPNLPIFMARMLAVLFLLLGLGLLVFGRTEGGFITLVVATIALLTGLFKRPVKDREPDD